MIKILAMLLSATVIRDRFEITETLLLGIIYLQILGLCVLWDGRFGLIGLLIGLWLLRWGIRRFTSIGLKDVDVSFEPSVSSFPDYENYRFVKHNGSDFAERTIDKKHTIYLPYNFEWLRQKYPLDFDCAVIHEIGHAKANDFYNLYRYGGYAVISLTVFIPLLLSFLKPVWSSYLVQTNTWHTTLDLIVIILLIAAYLYISIRIFFYMHIREYRADQFAYSLMKAAYKSKLQEEAKLEARDVEPIWVRAFNSFTHPRYSSRLEKLEQGVSTSSFEALIHGMFLGLVWCTPVFVFANFIGEQAVYQVAAFNSIQSEDMLFVRESTWIFYLFLMTFFVCLGLASFIQSYLHYQKWQICGAFLSGVSVIYLLIIGASFDFYDEVVVLLIGVFIYAWILFGLIVIYQKLCPRMFSHGLSIMSFALFSFFGMGAILSSNMSVELRAVFNSQALIWSGLFCVFGFSVDAFLAIKNFDDNPNGVAVKIYSWSEIYQWKKVLSLIREFISR